MTADCIQFGKQYNFWESCTYPFPFPPRELFEGCNEKAAGDNCVYMKCVDDSSNFTVDGKIHVEHVTQEFQRNLAKMELLESEWMPVIQKSIEFCQTICKLIILTVNLTSISFLQQTSTIQCNVQQVKPCLILQDRSRDASCSKISSTVQQNIKSRQKLGTK
jgi:hypothetical protein